MVYQGGTMPCPSCNCISASSFPIDNVYCVVNVMLVRDVSRALACVPVLVCPWLLYVCVWARVSCNDGFNAVRAAAIS